MSKGIGLLSLLFFTVASQAAVDTKIIESEAASAITLAGRIGEAALFAVQADDDDDLEIFATASSQIDNQNDHWILLDWDSSDYQIIKTGSLQANTHAYLSGYQVSHSELLLGQSNGQLTTITFTDNVDEDNHHIIESQTLLSALTHEEIDGANFDSDIKAIVNLMGTDDNNYTVICSDELIHILNGTTLTSTLQDGGYCQTGNIDYETVADKPEVYDQELVTEQGLYFNFNGTNWVAKSSLSSSEFGDSFKIANIDDDDAQEILSQQQNGQLQSFSPAGSGSWVFISELKDAKNNFNVMDTDADADAEPIMEIIFDYIDTDEDPEVPKINKVYWKADDDSHVTDLSTTSPYKDITSIKRLSTSLTGGVEGDYFLFASNAKATKPSDKLFKRLNESDLSANWSGIYSSHGRSFDTLVKIGDADTLANHNLVQIEQIDLGEDSYEYAYKFFSTLDLSFQSIVEPTFTDHEIVSVNSLSSFDFNGDGVDELHAGGAANYANNIGIVIASKLDGTELYTLDTPTLASVSALYIGDVNLQFGTDIIATGKDISDGGDGIGIHFHYDSNNSVTRWFAPGTGDTEFKSLIASNIKGNDKPEILGLHSQLASYNPNAAVDESSFYNLSNLDLSNFTPISLENRDYQYALATDASGMLHLIEPKDFDILATTFACSSELSAIYSVRINNKTDVAFGVCEQNLLSWVVEYDENNEYIGYSFYELDSTDLGNADTTNAQLLSQITDPDDVDNIKTHLYALFNNKLQRFELNMALGEDTDKDTYLNYKDAFPNEITQWEDNDRDTFGDNQTGNAPDPSLNDIDNDGVKDDQDPDNDPVNDYDFSNDNDHGLPAFTVTTLETVNLQSTGDTTTVTLDTPTATDAYDAFISNTMPVVSANVAGVQLIDDGNGQHNTELASGKHSVTWLASDAAGNTATLDQAILIYPSIAFQSATQTVGETQTAQVTLTLSGLSPVYPLEVTIQQSNNGINDDDINGTIAEHTKVTFTDGQTEASVSFEFIDDSIQEETEELELTLVDNFNRESWAINEDHNTHLITVANLNHAPEVSHSITQDGTTTAAPTNTDGPITLAAIVNDIDKLNTHTYLWELTSLALDNQTFSTVAIDPSKVTPGDYDISLTVKDSGLPSLSTTENFTLTVVYGDSDGDGFADNIDDFLNDASQWLDADGDDLGDNPSGTNPDPSLNDKDNDGVKDDADSSNDSDNGSPTFVDATLELVKSESTGPQTSVHFAMPQANDLFDEYYNKGAPTISASVNGQALSIIGTDQFVASLSSGIHTVKWQARDKSGNTTNLDQEVWVFPSIAFVASQQLIGETQTATVMLNLSGTSPVYPLDVNIAISGGNIQNNDVQENIDQNLTVRFNQGATQASIDLTVINDNLKESTESLELSILDTFNSADGNESWTINESKQTHIIAVMDFNQAPTVNYSQIQNGLETLTPTNIAGMITLEALITDANAADTHSYTWKLSSLGLSSQSESIIQIDPENITPGEYEISLLVTDNGLPSLSTEEVFTLTIAYGDSDNDGVLDNVDAFPFDSKESVDTDGDGIGDVADERTVEDSAGALYFYLLTLLPFLFRRKITTSLSN